MYKLLILLTLMAASIFSTGQDKLPEKNWHDTADLNGDGLLDLVVAHKDLDQVKIHLADGDNNFVEGKPIYVNSPIEVALGHIDDDGNIDLVISGAEFGLVFYLHDGKSDFVYIDKVTLPTTTFGEVLISDTAFDGFAEVFLRSNKMDTLIRVSDLNDGLKPDEVTVAESNDVIDRCGPEPSCAPNTEQQGIQECMRAVACRRDICYWASCVLHPGWFHRTASTAACATVSLTERTLCLPTSLIPANVSL